MTEIFTIAEQAKRAATQLYRDSWGHEIAALEAKLAQLSPDELVRAERDCATAMRREASKRCLRGLTDRAVKRSPLLVSCSGDGYFREKALRAMTTKPDDLVTVAFLLVRSNDWVPQVRQMAMDRLVALVPQLNVVQLRRLLPFVLLRMQSWQRGAGSAIKALRQHPDWAETIYTFLLEANRGPLSRMMRAEMQFETLDPYLYKLATQAHSTQVRAVATAVLLNGEAKWQVGWRKRWISKCENFYRWEPVVETRPYEVTPDVALRVLLAAGRGTTSLRKLAADTFIRLGPQIAPELATTLQSDRIPTVRRRMEFMTRKWVNKETLMTG
ncbi:hypothetical protein [Shimia sp. R9_3]|uniref:hypothetical protein n=1 Tax=Shimia sp. R9_3 TaxID=2821113 RepID=UPI001ADB3D35|nr:hypothetical protein [Shimia sp. R9_3]MBO9402677.1 hypothetical protein [Shimia sp. R9_3]